MSIVFNSEPSTLNFFHFSSSSSYLYQQFPKKNFGQKQFPFFFPEYKSKEHTTHNTKSIKIQRNTHNTKKTKNKISSRISLLFFTRISSLFFSIFFFPNSFILLHSTQHTSKEKTQYKSN